MNADRTIYGRYGTRSKLSGPGDVTDAGFRKAALAALELHRGYPGNKEELRGKSGAAPAFRVPQEFPALRRFTAVVDPDAGERNNTSCIHCHDIQGAQYALHRAEKKPIPLELIWPYPMPDAVGLALDPEERCTVSRVAPGSAAEKAGFKAGDEIARLEGQPLVSVADVQWILHGSNEGAKLTAEVRRGGRAEKLTLELPPGWRRGGDLTWREGTTVYFKPGLQATPTGRPEDGIALKIDRLRSEYETAGLQAGDVIVEVGGRRKGIASVSQLMEFVALNTSPGEKLALIVLREGKERRIELVLP